VVRYLATRHLGFLLRSGVAAFSDWGVMFLVKQLSDEHGKVVLEALQVLDEACDDVECLESLITRKPNLVNLGKDGKGKEIMIRFLSRNSGFTYLWNDTNLVKTELVTWRESEYVNYTLHLEKALQSNLHSSAWRQTSAKYASASDLSLLFLHSCFFYPSSSSFSRFLSLFS
jgi:rapamycin-insensitive companion of mTOR